MTRRRIGVIGLGMAVTPHARSLVDLADRAEVAYAFSPSETRRRSFAERFPFPPAESLDAVLADKSVDAVMILTPPNTHLDLVRRAAAAGKHILLEKPLEISTERSLALVETCRAAGVTLGVVLQHRFRPPAVKLRDILAAGELGNLVGASASIRLWRPQTYYDEPGRGTKARDGGGVLITQAIHSLDLMISLAGLPAEVQAYAATTPVHRMETEDFVAAAVRYPGGGLGTIEATTAAFPGYPERVVLMGGKGSASVEGTALAVAFMDGRKVELASDATGGGTGADPMDFPHDYHLALISDFLDALDEGRAPRITGEEALKVHFLIDALLEAGASGETVAVRQG